MQLTIPHLHAPYPLQYTLHPQCPRPLLRSLPGLTAHGQLANLQLTQLRRCIRHLGSPTV
jgi:hypothetical protein